MSEEKTVKEPRGLVVLLVAALALVALLGWNMVAKVILTKTYTASTICTVTDAGTSSFQDDNGPGQSSRRIEVGCDTNVASVPPRFRVFGKPYDYYDANHQLRSFSDDANVVHLTNGDHFACTVVWQELHGPLVWSGMWNNPFGPNVGLKLCHPLKR